jgi:hypothetical protein
VLGTTSKLTHERKEAYMRVWRLREYYSNLAGEPVPQSLVEIVQRFDKPTN